MNIIVKIETIKGNVSIEFSSTEIKNQYNALLLLLTACTGNFLGSVANWICVYCAAYIVNKKWFSLSQTEL